MDIIKILINFLGQHWIAILALIISMVTLYASHLKPFSLKIHSAGRFSLSINPTNSSQIAISPVLIFANEGAKKGIVENLALILKAPNNRKFLLMPQMVIDDMDINTTRESEPLAAKAFVKFSLSDKEWLAKQVMFIPPFPENFILDPGIYTLEIFAKSSDDKKLQQYAKMAIQIDAADITEILKNIPKLGPGESTKVEAFFRNKITSELDEQYKALLPYIEEN